MLQYTSLCLSVHIMYTGSLYLLIHAISCSDWPSWCRRGVCYGSQEFRGKGQEGAEEVCVRLSWASHWRKRSVVDFKQKSCHAEYRVPASHSWSVCQEKTSRCQETWMAHHVRVNSWKGKKNCHPCGFLFIFPKIQSKVQKPSLKRLDTIPSKL